MNTNIYKNILATTVTALTLTLATGCGDSLLDDINANTEIGGEDDELTTAATLDQAAGMLLTAQQKLHDIEEHQYQYQSNLHIDNYCGYLCAPQNFDGRLPSTYAYNLDFSTGPRGSFFNVSRQALPVMRGADRLGIPEIGALANIIYCYAAQELADVYGPFPWWDYKQENQDPPLTYYSVEEIYDSINADLVKSAALLSEYSNTSLEHQDTISELLKKDRICGGDIDLWIRFANSLRLRMAMHISVIDGAKAKQWATEAINNGVLEFTDQPQNVAYDVTAQDGNSNGNPLAFISNSWKDTRLNASLENLLKRLGSPMLERWFMRNPSDIKDARGNITLPAGSAFVGMRSGIATTPRNDDNMYVRFSNISTGYNFHPVYLMKVSEVQFLLAEAALRWGDDVAGGPANFFYESGVIAGLMDEDVTDADTQNRYLDTQSADTTIHYIDYFDSSNNAKGLVTIGVSWDESDSRETKLEKIITQKYIANFPMGLEAWTDLRRTGFPRIFPVIDDDGDGSIPEGGLIRRIPYPISDDSDKQDIVNSAMPLLGADLQATRLWWDVADPSSPTGQKLFADE